jgi:hypothetical protein
MADLLDQSWKDYSYLLAPNRASSAAAATSSAMRRTTLTFACAAVITRALAPTSR